MSNIITSVFAKVVKYFLVKCHHPDVYNVTVMTCVMWLIKNVKLSPQHAMRKSFSLFESNHPLFYLDKLVFFFLKLFGDIIFFFFLNGGWHNEKTIVLRWSDITEFEAPICPPSSGCLRAILLGLLHNRGSYQPFHSEPSWSESKIWYRSKKKPR